MHIDLLVVIHCALDMNLASSGGKSEEEQQKSKSVGTFIEESPISIDAIDSNISTKSPHQPKMDRLPTNTTQKRGSMIKLWRRRGPLVLERSPDSLSSEVDGTRRNHISTFFGRRPASRRCLDSFNTGIWASVKRKAIKYAKFIGPGFLVSVAYIDPGKH